MLGSTPEKYGKKSSTNAAGLSALSVAAFLDDQDKWDQAVEVYRMDAGAALRCSLPNGEVGDAGRDDHWFVQDFALMWASEVAWKQGVDLYSEYGNRLFSIGELYNKYAFVGDTMTFTPFGGYANYWTNWGIAPGARRRRSSFHRDHDNGT